LLDYLRGVKMRSIAFVVSLSLMCAACGAGDDLDDSPDVKAGLVADMAPDADVEADAEADGADAPDASVDMTQLCPIARAGGYLSWLGAAGEPAAMVTATPLATITLSGLASEAVEGELERFTWRLVSTPSGSNARLTPNSSEPMPNLFLDLAGTYELELDVTDAAGRVSCEPARVVVVARPCACGLSMQLTWEAPEGAGQGPVMGVRYADQLAARWDDARVLSSPSQSPDWGVVGAAQDDPALDSDGSGSPVMFINHAPVLAGSYRLGVSYDAAQDVGPTYATVRYYNDGQLIQELRSPALEAGAFWEVGELAWPGAGFTRLDRVSEMMPELIAR
jgi:hypothetical protein